MKNCLILFFLLFAASASAQYYHNPNRPGVDRSLAALPSTQTSVKKQEKPDVVEINIQKLKDALALDSFQEAVARQLLSDAQKQEEIVFGEDIPQPSKFEKIVALREKLNSKIKEILTPEQVEKYDNLGKKKKK